MDQMQDIITDKNHRRPPKSRCYLSSCFGGGGVSEDHFIKPQRKPKKSIIRSGWFSCSRFRSKKFPKRTVPVDSSTDDQNMINIIHEITAPPTNIPNKSCSSSDQLPTKDDSGILTQPPPEVAGQLLIGKDKKTRSGKGNILLGNSKSMNHIQSTSKHVASSSLRKCTSTKYTTSLINQPTAPATGSHLVENSHPQVQPMAALIGGGDSEGVKINKTKDEKNKGSFDRVVGISFILMVLLIMVLWGKLYAILCFSVWLYFYPFLNIAKKSGQQDHVGQTKDSKPFELHTNSLGCKKKVVFQGFLQRDHHVI